MCAAELTGLGAEAVPETGGVRVTADTGTVHRIMLWSRTAQRVLWIVAEVPATDADSLHAQAAELPWENWLDPASGAHFRFNGRLGGVRHSTYGGQRVKDAINDRLRSLGRPRLETGTEAVAVVDASVWSGKVRLALDLGGGSLHRRGYRPEEAVEAPMKETLAAAMLLRAGWPAIAAAGGPLVDPFCGSGTFLVEGLGLACDIAPGLGSLRPAFAAWPGFDAGLWERLQAEAGERRAAGLSKAPPVFGSDRDPRAVSVSLSALEATGSSDYAKVERRDVSELVPPDGTSPGLVITNPPYGERLGDSQAAAVLYRSLGERLRAGFQGWDAAVFVGRPELGRALGLKASATHPFRNGPIEGRLLRLRVEAAAERDPVMPTAGSDTHGPSPGVSPGRARGERPNMLANRLRKNLKASRRWRKKEGVSCFRAYDADLPEYNVAVDLYRDVRDGLDRAHVQEYAAPASVAASAVRERLSEALAVVSEVLEIPAERIVYKQRRRQSRGSQYQAAGESGERMVVEEGGLRFHVDLTAHLDTGLFLDHRRTRARLRELAADRDMLNLFSYTGTATVYAAAGGARSTTSVDLSNTYLDRARANLVLNGFEAGERHRLIRADCLEWLRAAVAANADPRRKPRRYGLIFLDPPTASRSKGMEGELDIQRDHARLIGDAVRLLTPDGVLVFSTNFRKFRLDAEAVAELDVRETTRETLPPDFQRRKIHRTWEIRKR